MAKMTCPPWIGYLLINPLRKLFENPDKILGQFILEGMVVLEPGCGMGYFTLPLARMVGPEGKVVALDIQPKMLSVLERRARKADFWTRIEARLIERNGLGLEDLSGRIDFTAAIHMVHEVPDQGFFLKEVWRALKPGGRLLVIEPKGHVSPEEFARTMDIAERLGFKQETSSANIGERGVLLVKPFNS
ncbi:MAG: class I SAM-dependent methyltransferase [Deltaproteobacteria bacterium]|nr:class I SAM-dependent methyltransferase [Deltaproteobacteria bacterium]